MGREGPRRALVGVIARENARPRQEGDHEEEGQHRRQGRRRTELVAPDAEREIDQHGGEQRGPRDHHRIGQGGIAPHRPVEPMAIGHRACDRPKNHGVDHHRPDLVRLPGQLHAGLECRREGGRRGERVIGQGRPHENGSPPRGAADGRVRRHSPSGRALRCSPSSALPRNGVTRQMSETIARTSAIHPPARSWERSRTGA